jgi:hypothetical protein
VRPCAPEPGAAGRRQGALGRLRAAEAEAGAPAGRPRRVAGRVRQLAAQLDAELAAVRDEVRAGTGHARALAVLELDRLVGFRGAHGLRMCALAVRVGGAWIGWWRSPSWPW